jgi:hypothetical protein
MKATAASYLFYSYRSNTVRVPYCQWHGFAIFCHHCRRENGCHWDATDTMMNMNNSVTSDFYTPHRKVKTLIPIALLLAMTAELHPAVSSLEACQTPAR